MSHEIEQRADGTALAVFNRTPAWHELGARLSGSTGRTFVGIGG